MHIYDWAIIGAGPAGIAAVGKLLDKGVSPHKIIWLDPRFKVGDLGRFWPNVSSNTKVKLFIAFLNEIKAFNFPKIAPHSRLCKLPVEQVCQLCYVVEPLQWITDSLRTQVNSEKHWVNSLELANNNWSIETKTQIFSSKKVILATGATPQSLNYDGVKMLSLETALDKNRLQKVVSAKESVAVFGSSHSAMIAIQNLVELKIHKIINFYKSPVRYAIDMDDWILFDNTGLKANTAKWSRNNIDGKLPDNLERVLFNEETAKKYLQSCDKCIYAIGFESRREIKIKQIGKLKYNPHSGIIAPGLFGFGIGFPELKSDPLGNYEWQVGMWKFMTYLKKVMPIWLRYLA